MPMVTPRAEAGFSLLGNQVYTIGGYSWDRNERLASVERYDVEKDRFVHFFYCDESVLKTSNLVL